MSPVQLTSPHASHSGTAFPRSIAYTFFRWISTSFAQIEFVSQSIGDTAEMRNPSFNSTLIERSLKGVRARRSQRHAAHTKARIRKLIKSIEPAGSFSNIPQDVAPVLSLFFSFLQGHIYSLKASLYPNSVGLNFLLARNTSGTGVLCKEV